MAEAARGEVWLVDLGLAAKVRPCLVLNVALDERDRALVAIIPHTTAVRGSRFEVPVETRFLRAGAFDVQGLAAIPQAKLLRRLGHLSPHQFEQVTTSVRAWLGL
jgi:mRNA interferase MazF